MPERAPHATRRPRPPRRCGVTARFFERLEHARIGAGLTIDDLAARAGVCRALYFTLRRGRSCNLDRADALARAAGKSLAELLA